MIDVYKILENTTVEGPGNRFCIWVQGCKKHCPHCWAKETWAFGIGQKYRITDLFSMIKNQQSSIEGVTFFGGEPFEQAKDLAELSKLIKSLGLSILCFTGYTIEELKSQNNNDVNNFLSQIDLLIDGGFEKENYDLSRPWVGSSNQRYHFLTNFYNPEIIKKYKNKIEVHINQNGKVEINGMGDFSSINKNFCLQLGKDNVK